jgi:hypothetical protein
MFPTEYRGTARIQEYKGLAPEKCVRGAKKAAVETQQQWRKHEQECSLHIRDVTQQVQ